MRRRKSYVGKSTEGCRLVEVWCRLEYEVDPSNGNKYLYFRTLDNTDILKICSEEGHQYQTISIGDERFVANTKISGSPDKMCYMHVTSKIGRKWFGEKEVIQEGEHRCVFVKPNDPEYPSRWILSELKGEFDSTSKADNLMHIIDSMGIYRMTPIAKLHIAKHTKYEFPFSVQKRWSNIQNEIEDDSWLLGATRHGYVLYYASDYYSNGSIWTDPAFEKLIRTLYTKYKEGEIGTMKTNDGTFQLSSRTRFITDNRVEEVE